VSVVADPASTAAVTLGAVRDHGDGSYSFPVTAGTATGSARFLIAVDDGRGPRRLSPSPEVRLVNDTLWTDRAELSVAAGGTLQLAVQPGPVLGAGRPFALLASNSGTTPGLRLSTLYTLPLNPDALFHVTLYGAFTGTIPELIGVTSARGTAATRITFPPGTYGLPADSGLSFAYVLFDPAIFRADYASRAVTVRLVP
jgi:hypothetical protein